MKATMPAHIAKQLENSNVIDTSSMDTGSSGVPRISLKKSKFTAKIGEEEKKLGEEIKVVIVGISPEQGFSKTYYESGYSPNSADAPTCQSTDGIRPDGFVEQPISDLCRTCEKSQWGSAKSMTGGKAKACKDSKRLHVILEEDIEEEEPIVYIMNVTVLSLKPFSKYGKELYKQNISSPTVVITKLGFDDEASVPKLTFEAVEYLTEKQLAPAVKIAEEKPWDAWKNMGQDKLDKPKAAPPKELANASSSDEDDALDLWD